MVGVCVIRSPVISKGKAGSVKIIIRNYLPERQSLFVVLHLLTNISGDLDEQSEAALFHFPFMEEEARHNCQELAEVALVK